MYEVLLLFLVENVSQEKQGVKSGNVNVSLNPCWLFVCISLVLKTVLTKENNMRMDR